jgi:hypothetical protein
MTTRCIQREKDQSKFYEHAAVLRSFASLFSSHVRRTTIDGAPTTSPECLQRQQIELPLLFAASPRDVTDMKNNQCCSVPCLQLRQKTGNLDESSFVVSPGGKSCFTQPRDEAATKREGAPVKGSQSPSSIEHDTAEALSRRITVTTEEIVDLPLHLLTNCTATFEALWQARIRQAVKALLSRRFSVHDTHIATLLAKMGTQHPTAVVSTFRTLDYVDQCKKSANAESDETTSPSDTWIVVPVIMELVLDWIMLDTVLTVSTAPIQSPGVLQGQFRMDSEQRLLLEHVDMELDTRSLLAAMMIEVKKLVRQAMAVATHQARQQSREHSLFYPESSLIVNSTVPKTACLINAVPTKCAKVERDSEHGPFSVATVADDESDDCVDDQQEGMAEAALILAEKTPLQALFEAEALGAQPAGIWIDDASTKANHISPISPSKILAVGLAEHPSMPPPPTRAPSIETLFAKTHGEFGHSSRKRSASD